MAAPRSRSAGLETYRKKVRDSNRKAILSAAKDLFLDSGFSQIAMTDIAQQAQVSTATLYKHFRSKEDLFAAMIKQTYVEIASTLTTKVADMPAEDVILGLAEELVIVHHEGGLNSLMRIVITEACSNPQLGQDFLHLTSTLRQGFVINYLNDLVAAGKLAIPDTRMAALQIRGVFKEIYVWPAFFNPDYRPSAADARRLRDAIRLILQCYQPKS